MKLVNYRKGKSTQIGLLHNARVLPFHVITEKTGIELPNQMEYFIRNCDEYELAASRIDKQFKAGDFADLAVDYAKLDILAPVQQPASMRDGYAFRQHVAAARKNRGVEMIPEFDQFPIFYFTNHHSIIGPGPVPCMIDHFDKLDFELEAAIVIKRRGRNIEANQADDYIFGYTILNDFSARTLQMEEMLLSLGPAKGKDFANAIGPILVTPDELETFKVDPPAGHVGCNYRLRMQARVNGIQISDGNLADMDWTFAEIIERASYGADIHPTDLIGSGTVGTGCFLETNGTGKRLDPNFVPQWLKEGDIVELEIDQLGILRNTIAKEGDVSILKKKKGL